MKKILKVFLVVALLLPLLGVSALSGTNEKDVGKITIDNAVVGKTYKVYQILKLESFTKDEAYSYTVNDKWQDFALNEGSEYLEVSTLGYVSWKGENTEERVLEFASKALEYANKVNSDTDESNDVSFTEKVASSESVIFDNLNLGYYLLDSSIGLICSIDTTDNETIIKEKNSVPTVDKKVEENGTYGKENDANIGDVVNFKTTITVGKGSQDYVLRDTMSEGFTFDIESITVVAKKENGTSVETKDLYTVNQKKKDETFTIEFSNTLTKEVGVNGTIDVFYSAILNENAIVGSVGNTNDVSLDYGDNHTTESTPTKTYTYLFDLVKTKKSGEVLLGAEFELYDVQDNLIKVEFVKEENGINVYRVNTESNTPILAGIARIEGLDTGSYYLKETKIPEGYNKLASNPTITITINGANNESTIENNMYKNGGLQVINYTGSELPSTGGIGTTLFITIGSLMVLTFGTLLITKLKINKENN